MGLQAQARRTDLRHKQGLRFNASILRFKQLIPFRTAMAKITEKEIANQAVARGDRLAVTGKAAGVEKATLKVAKTSPNRRRMTAAQALDGLVPLLTPSEGLAWLEQSRAGLDQELDEPLFLNLPNR
jgi:hypothetical protein